MNVMINDNDYYEILSEVGYPVILEEDLEYKRADILTLFIYPAMKEYFTYFPIKRYSSYNISRKLVVDFPSVDTYGILDARVGRTGNILGGKTSQFIDNVEYERHNSRLGRGLMDTRPERILHRLERASSYRYRSSVNIRVDDAERKVYFDTNASGEVSVTWAEFSHDFSTIPFRRKQEVIDLAKAKVLKGFAMLRGQITAEGGVGFDVSSFNQRAKELSEMVNRKWKGFTKAVILRG